MNFRFDETEVHFRQQVRDYLASALPPEIRNRQRRTTMLSSNLDDQRRWISILHKQGWSVPHWPTEHGGTDWTPLQRFIFEDELYAADAPEFHWIGSHMVGPVICKFGSKAQMEKFLPPIRSGEHIWAQGFSEPGAGSDLASLRTSAALQGGHYLVNGQKIWTSGAFEADWGFFLVKTSLDDKPQKSISFLLIDLKSPGLTIRRIPQINGEAHLCEVFLDNVAVPADNLIGEAGRGWTYAKYLLDHERTASSFIYWNKRELTRARELACAETAGERPLIERPAFRARLAKLQTEVLALEWSVLRVLANEETNYAASAAASVLKLRGSELQQAITELHADLLGVKSLRYFDPAMSETPGNCDTPPDDLWPDYIPGRTSRALIARAATIYGGTKQVQKNILAKLAFGL